MPMILGELKRFLRDFRPMRVSRSLRDLAYRVMQTKEAYISLHQKEPTVDEIAELMGEKRSDIVTAMESSVDPISLYEPVYSDTGDALYIMDQVGDDYDDRSWLDELTVKDAIKGLQERERNILYLRFFRGCTQIEVAKQIGISQAQVSRLEKNTLDKIRTQL